MADVAVVRALGIPTGKLGRKKVADSLFAQVPTLLPAWMSGSRTETGAVLTVPGLVVSGLTVLDDGLRLELE
jgi:hypothetical protein